VSDSWDRAVVVRVTACGLAILVAVAMLTYLVHRRHVRLESAEDSSVASALSEIAGPPEPAGRPHTNENQILASCHPHLNASPESVPNIDVTEGHYNAAGIQLKVRFWVNGNGFVTQAFNTGASVYTAEQTQDALHYVKLLTFSVPNTPECKVRLLELIGNFFEARDSSGEWVTLFEMHPRYSFDGTHVVQTR